MIRVLIADDHGVIRDGLGRLISALEDIELAGVAADGAEAVERCRALEPDVVLMDLDMPRLDGIEATRRILADRPETAVLVLTSFSDRRRIMGALEAGASGYLLKDTDPDRLPAALRGVLSGEAAIPRSLVARILDEFREPGRRRLGRRSRPASLLSSREWEVMALLAEGLTTDEVAKRLFLSPTTVRVHVSSVLRKLRVKDRQAAIDLLRDDPS